MNLDRSRVAPNLILDFSFGSQIWMRGTRSAIVQFDLRNATNRLNVINFSGLFSATAIGPGRRPRPTPASILRAQIRWVLPTAILRPLAKTKSLFYALGLVLYGG